MNRQFVRRSAWGALAVFFVATTAITLHLPHAQAAVPNGSTLNTHAVMVDEANKIVSWVPTQDQAYAEVSRLAWEYMTRYNPGDSIKEVPLGRYTNKPLYYSQSYMDPDTQEPVGWPSNPGSTFAMLIESALTYYRYAGTTMDGNNDGEADFLQLARDITDWHLANGMTTATDHWANVPYASGQDGELIYRGSNNTNGSGDGPGVIEPDKIGELGHNWVELYKLTGDTRYLNAAINGANALASHIRPGDATKSPWPFRVVAATNVIKEEYTSHVIAPIELFDDLIELNQGNVAAYTTARTTAWNWLMQYPMQNNLWSGYFEDVSYETNPANNKNQLDAMMVARYLLTHPEKDPLWETHVRGLITWVEATFGRDQFGAKIIEEQQNFDHPMGSHTSRYGSVNALLYAKTGDLAAKEKAYRSLNWATYMMRSSGVGIDGPEVGNQWFTDSYGDFIRHFMVAMSAVPEFAPNGQVHILSSTSVVKNVLYNPGASNYINVNSLSYQTFNSAGIETIKVNRMPDGVHLDGNPLTQRNDLQAEGWVYNQTDSTVSIRRNAGTTVSIGFSGPPTNIYPNVSLSTPSTTYTAPASFVLTANASDPDGSINRVEFYQNGTLLGTKTSVPFTHAIQNLTAGNYSFTARAYDNQDAFTTSSAVAVAVNPAGQPGGALIASTPATTKQTASSSSITSPTFTAAPGNLIVAFLSSDGSGGSTQQSFSSVTTTGLTWTLKRRTNPAASGTSEIWTAVAPNGFTGGTATATRASGTFPGMISVVVFSGADTAAIAATAGASGNGTAPSVGLTTTRAGSWVWGVGNDWSNTTARTAGTAQTITDQLTISSAGAFWVQRQNNQTPAPGLVTINNPSPSTDTKWNLAAIEIVPLPAGDTTPPVITMQPIGNVNINGATINWTTDEPSTSQVDYGLTTSYGFSTSTNTNMDTEHVQVVAGLESGTTYHYRVRSVDAAGNMAVSGDNTFTTPLPPDTIAPSAPTNVAVTALSTTQAQINWEAATDNIGVADYLVLRDGTPVSTVTGTNTTDSSLTPGGTYIYTVVARDAAGNMSPASEPAGVTLPLPDTEAPTTPLQVTASTVTLSGVTLSWDDATDNVGIAGYRVLRDGTVVGTVTAPVFTDTGLQSGTNYSYTVVAFDAAGNDSPASDPLNVTTLTDMQAPTTPANFQGTSTTNSIALTWTPSTDNVAVTGYEVWRDGVLLGTTTTTTFTDTSLQSGTTYLYTLRAFDAAGNYSNHTETLSVTTITPDTTAPAVAITAPADNATVSGTVAITANATDAVGVTGVQFLVNGVAAGSEDTTAPYQYSWNTTGLSNGTYTLSAQARDAAGNVGTAANVTVTVNNPVSQLAIDRQVTAKPTSASTTVSTPALTTTKQNDLLVAFIASDGPRNNAQSIRSVTGGGLTWTLRQRTNTRAGTSEIWTAVAPNILTNAVITATYNTGSYVGFMTVVAFSGAETAVIGATGSANGASGAATVNINATRTGSQVWAIGNDWDRAAARTLGSGQTMVEQHLPVVGDTFWVQRLTTPTTGPGTVTLSTIAPTNDRWNFAAIEILAKQ